MDKYSGADWIERCSWMKMTMSPLGREVADLLGAWARGIYHIDRSVMKVDWSDEQVIEINLSNPTTLSTWDFDELTKLVILCHDRIIRCEIRAVAPGILKMCFTKRIRHGDISKRHPTIERAIELCRKEHGDPVDDDGYCAKLNTTSYGVGCYCKDNLLNLKVETIGEYKVVKTDGNCPKDTGEMQKKDLSERTDAE
jgi:hypothetical protein